MNEHDEKAYRAVWKALLCQLFLDARPNGYHVATKTGYRLSIQAARYLTTYSPDLQTVCDLAGVSCQSVMQAAQKIRAGKQTINQRLLMQTAQKINIHQRNAIAARLQPIIRQRAYPLQNMAALTGQQRAMV